MFFLNLRTSTELSEAAHTNVASMVLLKGIIATPFGFAVLLNSLSNACQCVCRVGLEPSSGAEDAGLFSIEICCVLHPSSPPFPFLHNSSPRSFSERSHFLVWILVPVLIVDGNRLLLACSQARDVRLFQVVLLPPNSQSSFKRRPRLPTGPPADGASEDACPVR